MEIKKAYNLWAEEYDTNKNRTRDLEGIALKEILNNIEFTNCLEIGCGTGKNTPWLLEKSDYVVSVDLSEEMLKKAKEKICSAKVTFIEADITKTWNFTTGKFDLIVFSLVLEHVQDLDFVFREAAKVSSKGGNLYIGELHPYKQYSGTKARFETSEGLQIVECYNHHISDFIKAAKVNGFELIGLNEFFDDEKDTPPRILSLLLKKI